MCQISNKNYLYLCIPQSCTMILDFKIKFNSFLFKQTLFIFLVIYLLSAGLDSMSIALIHLYFVKDINFRPAV